MTVNFVNNLIKMMKPSIKTPIKARMSLRNNGAEVIKTDEMRRQSIISRTNSTPGSSIKKRSVSNSNERSPALVNRTSVTNSAAKRDTSVKKTGRNETFPTSW